MNTINVKGEIKANLDDNRNKYLVGLILGVITFIAGAIIMKLDLEFVNKALPGVLVGVGAGVFGGCGGTYVRLSILKKHPAEAHKYEIEEKDERNVMLRDKAKSKAFSVMELIYCILMLIFTLLNVELVAILIFVAFYLFGEGVMFYYLYKYSKEL
jgi:hypothetical protein